LKNSRRSSRRSKRRTFAPPSVLLLLFLFSGCAALPPLTKRPTPPAGPAPESLRARAVVTLKRDVTVSGRAVIVAKSPDRFRIEVFAPLGQVAATLASDGATLMVFSDGRLRSYDWTDPLFPYSFSSGDVVALLTGSGPFDGETTDRAGRRLRYSYETGPGGRPSVVTKTVEGREVLRAKLGDWRAVDGAVVPYRISIDDGTQLIDIRYSSVEAAPEVGPGVFSIPEGR